MNVPIQPRNPGPALGELFEAPYLRHVELRAGHLSLIVQPNRDFGVALNPSHGVDRDFLHRYLSSNWQAACFIRPSQKAKRKTQK